MQDGVAEVAMGIDVAAGFGAELGLDFFDAGVTEGLGRGGEEVVEVLIEAGEAQFALVDLNDAASADDFEAVDFAALGGAGVERTHGAARPLHDRLDGIGGRDVMEDGGRPGVNAGGHANQPADEVEVMRRLVHQQGAALAVPAATPVVGLVVGGGAGPGGLDVDVLDLPQLAGLDDAFGGDEFGTGALLVIDGEQAAGFGGGLVHGIGLGGMQAHGLFAEHVGAGAQGGDGDVGVKLVLGDDDDGLGADFIEQLPVVRVPGAVEVGAGLTGAVLQDIADGDDLVVAFLDANVMHAADGGAGADQGVLDFSGH